MHNKLNLPVSDKQIADEYKLGNSIYALAKKYNTRYGVIKRRITNNNTTLRKLKSDILYTKKEDNIIIALRNDGYSLREISVGLFSRSVKSVMSRIVILKRDRKVV